MATVDVVSWSGSELRLSTHQSGDVQSECTCGWKSPRYGPSDADIALVGGQAHLRGCGGRGHILLKVSPASGRSPEASKAVWLSSGTEPWSSVWGREWRLLSWLAEWRAGALPSAKLAGRWLVYGEPL